MSVDFELLIAFCRANQRVCPMPNRWQELWQFLPEKRRAGAGWQPELPLILAAWDMPYLAKMTRFTEHLEWARNHGALHKVDEFLRGLEEHDWLHAN